MSGNAAISSFVIFASMFLSLHRRIVAARLVPGVVAPPRPPPPAPRPADAVSAVGQVLWYESPVA